MKKTMKKVMITIASAVLLGATTTSVQAKNDEAHTSWSYEGATDPQHWAELSPSNVVCGKGKNQSPVNIDTNTTTDIEQEPIKLNYSMLVADSIKNTGHSIQVDMRSGGSITLDGEEFKLKQLHFHTPSENTVNGKHFPMETHFVHQNNTGDLAVLAMMFIPGKEDRTIANLWKNMPSSPGDSARLTASDLKSIESDTSFSNYYRYNGSLTTPPCTEGVRWVVMQTPMTVSQEQVKALQQVLKHSNNRPVQKLNARIIME